VVYTHREAGVEIAYDWEGVSGDPVALVHGGWDDRTTWGRVVPGLAVAFQVLTYDRRGHGESSPVASSSPVRDDARDLASLLEATGLYPAHLLAQGYGAAPALRLAIDRPELVRGIAVHEPPFLGLLSRQAEEDGRGASHGRLRETMGRAVSLGATGKPQEAAQAFLDLAGAPSEQWAGLEPAARQRMVRNATAWAREMSDPAATDPSVEELRAIAVPLLVSSGARSPAWTSVVAAQLVAALANAVSVRLDEGGHFVQWTDPDLLVGVVGSFLLERNVPPT
jgi:pimeloyl-ACP methyl ester carboxylesterase